MGIEKLNDREKRFIKNQRLGSSKGFIAFFIIIAIIAFLLLCFAVETYARPPVIILNTALLMILYGSLLRIFSTRYWLRIVDKLLKG